MSETPTTDNGLVMPESDCNNILVTEEEDISALLGALNDSRVRAIIEALGEKLLSAQELSNKCDIPLSTTYRRVNELSELGLLAEKTIIEYPGKHTVKYRCCIDEIVITNTGDGITVQISTQ